MAAQCRPSVTFRPPPPFDPAAAAAAAERHRHRVEAKRVFLADRIAGLRDAGRITSLQHRAAQEIQELLSWASADRQVLARSQFRERLAASNGEALAMQERLEEAERTRFRPWKVWAGQFAIGHGRTLEGLTLAVVVEGHGLRQVANAWRMDQRRVLALLLRSLSCYVTLAGWDAPRANA